MKVWLESKKGLIKNGVVWSVIALAIVILLMLPGYVSAGKADQDYFENYTCENFTDNVGWSVISAKAAEANQTFNWTMENICPGSKDCDIFSIFPYARYVNVVASTTSSIGGGYTKIANSTESPTESFTGVRYAAYANETIDTTIRDALGPVYECGVSGDPDTCNTTNAGFENTSVNYSVMLYAGYGTGGNKWRLLVDDFNIKYAWCWYPLIHDINVSVESATYDTTFTFSTNVTNPPANTTVYLWTRSIGGTWQQDGNWQACANCSAQPGYDHNLTFDVTFNASQVGNREFKFNATDDQGNVTDANASSTTNECLDAGNDCIFSILDAGGADPGSPDLTNEQVFGGLKSTAGWGEDWNFTVDGVEQDSVSGNIGWQTKTFDLSAGTHTLRWEYYNYDTFHNQVAHVIRYEGIRFLQHLYFFFVLYVYVFDIDI